MRTFLAALLFAIALALLGVQAGPGRAATPALEPQQLADRSAAWLEQQLHVPIPTRPVLPGTPEQMEVCVTGATVIYAAGRPCVAVAYPDAIYLGPSTWRGVQQVGRLPRGALVNPNADAFALIHEQLHSTRDAARLDEGIVDALAIDLTPAWLRAVAGVSPGSFYTLGARYPAEVALVRRASAAAAGAHWSTRAARAIRRAWWALPSRERDAAVRAALRLEA